MRFRNGVSIEPVGQRSSAARSGDYQIRQPPRPTNRDRTRLVVVAASAGQQWFHQRVGTTRGRMRRIILVALARKLIVALWRYLSVGLVPDGAQLKA